MHACAASLGGNSPETVFGKSDSSADVLDNPVHFEGTRLELAQPKHEDRQSTLAKKIDFVQTVVNMVTT